MKTIKKIFFYLFFGLSFLVRGQQVGNYLNNGSFEDMNNCLTQQITNAKYWNGLGSNNPVPLIFSTCSTMASVPLNGFTYQWPKYGNNYVGAGLYLPPQTVTQQKSIRSYLRNQLKENLQVGKTYCVSFYVNITTNSTYGIDGIGAYFGGDDLDTIQGGSPLTYLNPQIQNPTNNIITDTLNWVLITGTFVANGTEKYMAIGNFKSDSSTNTLIANPMYLPTIFCDVLFDDVSCIELNLPAYAGRDTTIYLGDSLFIGRQPDFATDTGCVWYKLPNMTTSLDTISGIWVKPSITSTYVVRQVLDCSPLKWDTVVVTVSTNFVGLDKLQNLSDNINLFPNPTSDNLSISGFICSDHTTFSISNCLGQNILKGDIIQKNNLITIETSDLESGLYQIHLKTQYGIVTKKFVKTN